jgi:hypothetical protein
MTKKRAARKVSSLDGASGVRPKTKILWSRADRRGPADTAGFVKIGAIRLPRVNDLGLRTKSENLGGVPAGPINASALARTARVARSPGGGAGGAACPVDVTRQSSSGRLITNPSVVLLWWSTHFWDQHITDRHYYRDALRAVASDSAFWNRLSEYGIDGGSFGGQIDLTRFGGPSQSVTEQAIQDALTFRFDNLNSAPDASSIYVVMLPNGIQSAFDSANGFIGHHRFCDYNGTTIWYAVVEYSSDTRRTLNVITHEVYEAATDPDLATGYWDPSTGGETEVGDLCNLQTLMIDNYPVQQVWSQAGCTCV